MPLYCRMNSSGGGHTHYTDSGDGGMEGQQDISRWRLLQDKPKATVMTHFSLHKQKQCLKDEDVAVRCLRQLSREG